MYLEHIVVKHTFTQHIGNVTNSLAFDLEPEDVLLDDAPLCKTGFWLESRGS